MNKNNNKVKAFFYFLLSVLAIIYALPNFYSKEPAVTIIPKNQTAQIEFVKEKLNNNKEAIGFKELTLDENGLIVKFNSIDEQMKGYDKVSQFINEDDYYKNLNLVSTQPDILNKFNASPANLGLDLRGGVHFLMEVDSEEPLLKQISKINRTIERNTDTDNKVVNGEIHTNNVDAVEKYILEHYPSMFNIIKDGNNGVITFNDSHKNDVMDSIVKQNIITLNNRVNELGVAEPVIQRQGDNRIIIQLPGIQDTQKAKEIIGATATLDFRAVKEDNVLDKHSEHIKNINEDFTYLFYKEAIISGDSIVDANSGFDPQTSSPLVSVELDSEGGDTMLEYTTENKGKLMGSVLRTTTIKTIVDENGNEVKNKEVKVRAINVARISGVFSNRFQITGLDDKDEAHKLSILLKSGALAAPVEIIEERTIGPNLGAENIKKGQLSIFIGFALVLIIMAVKYRTLGMIANFCVFINMMALLSILSIMGATLTLPGIAGIILTVGMAVDANVVIFERIKEEYQKKKNVSKSIKNGYNKALSSVVDANVTTFIAAVVLFSIGTGAVKGFAVTLLIGIITSLLTSIYLARLITEMYYKNKKEIKF
jgi:preprotein translocase subunit SecD